MPRLTCRGHLYAADEGKRPHAIRNMESASGDVSVSQHRPNDAALQQARRSWRNLDAGTGIRPKKKYFIAFCCTT